MKRERGEGVWIHRNIDELRDGGEGDWYVEKDKNVKREMRKREMRKREMRKREMRKREMRKREMRKREMRKREKVFNWDT